MLEKNVRMRQEHSIVKNVKKFLFLFNKLSNSEERAKASNWFPNYFPVKNEQSTEKIRFYCDGPLILLHFFLLGLIMTEIYYVVV